MVKRWPRIPPPARRAKALSWLGGILRVQSDSRYLEPLGPKTVRMLTYALPPKVQKRFMRSVDTITRGERFIAEAVAVSDSAARAVDEVLRPLAQGQEASELRGGGLGAVERDRLGGPRRLHRPLAAVGDDVDGGSLHDWLLVRVSSMDSCKICAESDDHSWRIHKCIFYIDLRW